MIKLDVKKQNFKGINCKSQSLANHVGQSWFLSLRSIVHHTISINEVLFEGVFIVLSVWKTVRIET